MKRIVTLLMLFYLLQNLFATETTISYIEKKTNHIKLEKLKKKFQNLWESNSLEIKEKAQLRNIPNKFETEHGFYQLAYFNGDLPIYLETLNADVAETISTSPLHIPSAYNLEGENMLIHLWDAGAVNSSHIELSGRTFPAETGDEISQHSSHVAGTMIASGVNPAAKGMAPKADIKFYNWENDAAEMAEAANNGAILSNHSYSYARGWYWYSTWFFSYWKWAGDENTYEDENFGLYNINSQKFDQIANAAPYYQIVVAAGNDRDDGPDDNSNHPADGDFDSISDYGISKNVITVGAVEDIENGYSNPEDVVMTSYSSWGPCDDGRIKPDIVSSGTTVFSCDKTSNDYTTISGTSMASASVTSSLALVQEKYKNENNTFMRASTLKALMIHCADEAGDSDGPDYKFGWGLMNTKKMIDHIDNSYSDTRILELRLNNQSEYSISIPASGDQPLKATLCWTDPAAEAISGLDPSDIMLVNDLDMRITEKTNIYYPWKLDKNNPNMPATNNSDNNIDNVEQIFIANPEQKTYTITISHKDLLVNEDGEISNQDFALIISGIAEGLPTCTITNPNSGDVLNHGENIEITAIAEDPDGEISKVEFYINNQLCFTDYTPPYSYFWDTTFENYGDNEIKAIAFDNDNNRYDDINYITLSEPYQTIYQADFSDTSDWNATNGSGDWINVVPTFPNNDHTGNGTCFITNGNNNYESSKEYILTSPTIDLSLTEENHCSFWMWLDAEFTQSDYDGAFIQVYTNNQWQSIESSNLSVPYDNEINENYNNPAANEPAWTYDKQDWTKVNVDLSEFSNSDFAIRFIFATDSSNNEKGWAIDDFTIIGKELTQVPGNASNFFPINGATNIPPKVTVCWKYQSLEGDLPIGFKVVKDQSVIADIPFNGNILYTLTLDNLPYNQNISWKIIPYNEAGECSTPLENHFTTIEEPVLPETVNTVTVGAVVENFNGSNPPEITLPPIELNFGIVQPEIELAFSETVNSTNIIYQVQKLPDTPIPEPDLCATVLKLIIPSNIMTHISLNYQSDEKATQVLFFDGSNWQNVSSISTTPIFENGKVTFNWLSSARTSDTFLVMNGDSELPVELASFTASINSNEINLSWRTITEHNSYGWNIYRSSTNLIENAQKLNNILIPAKGFCSEPTLYSYQDESELQINTEYWYWLEGISLDSASKIFTEINVLYTQDDDNDNSPGIPIKTALAQNFPNPFNPSTYIKYTLKSTANVVIEIYNAKGQKIKTYMEGKKNKGEYQIYWNGLDSKSKPVSSGIYFFKMRADDFIEIKKGLLLK